jgi:hypothetical protein
MFPILYALIPACSAGLFYGRTERLFHTIYPEYLLLGALFYPYGETVICSYFQTIQRLKQKHKKYKIRQVAYLFLEM